MNIVVIGGTGLIGSKLIPRLVEQGHHAVAASPKSGVNTLTGEGLAEALGGASVVVDVSNFPFVRGRGGDAAGAHPSQVASERETET